MFFSFVKDMKSWIFFFFGMLGLADAILWLDEGIATELSAVLYFNFLFIIFFVLFIVWRYRKEMKFARELTSLMEGPELDWHVALPETVFTRDKIVSEMLIRVAALSSKEIADLKHERFSESDYTAAWVHEVKAPLTAMKLTMDGHRSDPIIRKLEAEWLRVYLQIDQQLYISRLPTLETDYILESTAIFGLVTAEVRELASWCLEKNVAVEFEGESREVVTDVKWCRFIIRQLVTNAVKYSPSGGTIIIRTSVNSRGNIVLSIQDEGVGIKAHDLPRIFDKGFTGGTGRIYNAATGLGLYLAQTIAIKIGITLWAESGKEQGTTLYMMFSIENEFDQLLT